ncbi:MAG: P-loop NTPase fold protein [Planctomycetota bacterium]
MARKKASLDEVKRSFCLLSESPITSATDDRLGFKDVAKLINRRILETECVDNSDGNCRRMIHTTDVFAIYGPWGSGKSSLLAQVERAASEHAAWINFDALKYQTDEMILVPLLHRIADVCDTEDARRFFWGMIKALSAFATDVLIAGSGVSIKEPVKQLVSSIKNIPISEPSPADKLPSSRAKAIGDAFSGLIRLVLKKSKRDRLVIAIDNLDRCRPAALLEVLEAIHAILDENNVTFILAMDQLVCIRCIAARYGYTQSEAALYLEKMVPDYFRVPDPWVSSVVDDDHDAISRFLKHLLTDRACEPIKIYEQLLWAVIGSSAVMRNPRRIKRLLRRLSSFDSDWWQGHANESIAIIFVTVISDIWPGLYATFSIIEKSDWAIFIEKAEQSSKSKTWIDTHVDEAFYAFILALRQLDQEEGGLDTIRDYDTLDSLVGEMRQLGL